MSGKTDKMLAAQVVEFHKPYGIHEVTTPGQDLDKHDMLVKIAVASYCHTDSMVTENLMGTTLPCTGSHEGVGTVSKIGSAITEFQVGDRVLVSLLYHRCRKCKACFGPEKDHQYCSDLDGLLGVTINGAFAEYEIVDGREACKLPDNLSFQSAAPLACAGITMWGGLVRADLKEGETVAIVGGGGGLGHIGTQFAKALGLKVIVIEARDEGMELAEECGADFVFDAREGKEKVVEAVSKATAGNFADVTLNVSDAEGAAATSAAVTKRHGLLVQISQPTNVSIPFADIVFRDIRLHGSLLCSRGECQKMLELISKHGIKVRTNAFDGIKEVPKAVELAHSGKMQGKPVIIIDKEAIEKEKKSGIMMI